ncbi:MAG: Csu type fimbrial protein [Xanthobacteraceae bacterium]
MIVVGSSVARAQSCNFSITNLDFGSINLTANTTFTTTATLSMNCTGTADSTVRICPNINAGSGGTTTGNPRFLLNGGQQLNYNLFQDNGYTSVWGSTLWGFAGAYPAPTIDLPLNSSGSGSTTRTLYGQVWAGQQTLAGGTHTSSFAGVQVVVAYDYATAGTCTSIGSSHGTAAPFTASALNSTTCSVSASNVNFGSAGVLRSALDATGQVSIVCTSLAPYTVALNGGNSAATDPAQRKMSMGGEQITYGLYRDSGRTQAWGDSDGVNTVGNTGSGLTQNLTVYGRVPAQTTPSPGTYSDTVVVTVSY